MTTNIPRPAPGSDLRAEGEALYALVDTCSDTDLERVTPAYGWRALDVFVHLYYTDWMARLALTDAAAYTAELTAFSAAVTGADDTYFQMSRYQHMRVKPGSAREFIDHWHQGIYQLCDLLDDRGLDEEVNWFGRPMKLARLVAARQMETWAYGQDVFDLFRVSRTNAGRLYTVADFCVRTFGFSFANRGLQVPAARPQVKLTAPSGANWQWDGPRDDEQIVGSAIDFCSVVTQRRHLDDTDLSISGEVARQWMAIAQCIAGPPSDGPAPGERPFS